MPLDNSPEPPRPPQTSRRIKLYRYQWVGVAALAALPVLAVAGLFGESSRVGEVHGGTIEAAARSPALMRYNQLDKIEVRVRNVSSAGLDTVRVTLDTGFASRFSSVRAIPELERPYELALTNVPPNGTGIAVFEMRAEHRGRHRGTLAITAGRETLRVPLNVLVYP